MAAFGLPVTGAGGDSRCAGGLLTHEPNPTDADIGAAMSGNICRCGTQRIRSAIKSAAASK